METVTSPSSPVAKSVFSRQCFKVEDGKCVLKRLHAYYYQCQQINNWLMIYQALVKSNKVNLNDLPESGHIIETALSFIDDGLFADAKLLILQSLPQWHQLRYIAVCLITFYYAIDFTTKRGKFTSLNYCNNDSSYSNKTGKIGGEI